MSQVTAKPLTLAQNAYELFAKGDIDTLVNEIIAPDVTWVEPETLPEGGTYTSSQAVVENVFGRFKDDWGPDASVTPTSWIDAGDTIVAQGDFKGDDKDGNPFTVPFCHVMEFENGRLSRFRNHTDTALVLAKIHPPS